MNDESLAGPADVLAALQQDSAAEQQQEQEQAAATDKAVKPAPIKRKRYVFVSEAPPEDKTEDKAGEGEEEGADEDADEEPKKQKAERAKKPIKVVKPKYARTSSHPALHYLRSWGAKNSDWKFQKVRQMYLLHNMYNASRLSGMILVISLL